MKDKFDKNLSIENTIFDNSLKLYDITNKPFSLYGNCTQSDNIFSRMPENIAESVSEGVLDRSKRCAGVRVRFKTNSTRLGIKVRFAKALQFPAQSAISTKGFDVYIDNKYCCSLFSQDSNDMSYEQLADLGNSLDKDIIIYFPYNAVIEELFIAVDKSAQISEGNSYNITAPIIFYGSSITHGFCSSRPGNTFTAMLSRKLNADYINLGFSGVCRGEPLMAEYIASCRKSVFVCAYDHNESCLKDLKERHLAFYKKFRETDIVTPVLFVSSPNSVYKGESMYDRMKVVEDSYRYAIANGDKKVYFIDGQTIYPDDIRFDCTVDGLHPNDLGTYMIAEKTGPVLEKILQKNE